MVRAAAISALASSPIRWRKTFTADKGADKIDVSKYPAAAQNIYKTFSKRCSKCHTLARPINTDFEPSKGEEYIRR